MKKHTNQSPGKVRAVPPKPRRVQFKITTSATVEHALKELVQSGLYGNSVPEAAERLVCEGLVSRMKKSITDRMNQK